MTRSTNRSLLSIIGAVAAIALTAAPAMGDYSSVNSIVGDDRPATPGYSSPNAILADGDQASGVPQSHSVSTPNAILAQGDPRSAPADAGSPRSEFTSVNALTGADPVVQSAPTSTAGDGFEWGDALFGAGTMLALALAAFALSSVRRRSRPDVQPSH